MHDDFEHMYINELALTGATIIMYAEGKWTVKCWRACATIGRQTNKTTYWQYTAYVNHNCPLTTNFSDAAVNGVVTLSPMNFAYKMTQLSLKTRTNLW